MRSSRRIADSLGIERPTPSSRRTTGGRSAAHSAIAVNERAPANTAHTATDNTLTIR